MITTSSDLPGRVTQALPALSRCIVSPISLTLASNQSLALCQTGPQATRWAPSGVDVNSANSLSSAITRSALWASVM